MKGYRGISHPFSKFWPSPWRKSYPIFFIIWCADRA